MRCLSTLSILVLLSVSFLLAHAETNCTVSLQCKSPEICIEGICGHCQEDIQCKTSLNQNQRCYIPSKAAVTSSIVRFSNEPLGVCRNKGIFSPFSWTDIVFTLIVFIGGAIAAGSGIGGGGIIVPVLVTVGKFSLADAIPLSSVMIAGASIANFVQALMTKRLAKPERTLINYNITFIMQPFALGGTVIGLILNRTLPEWSILLLLSITLIITIYKTGKKAWVLFKKERNQKNEIEANFSELDNQIELDELSEQILEIDPKMEQLKAELELKETKTPWIKILIQVGVLILITVHSILLGGKSGKSIINIVACSAIYWILLFALIPVLVSITTFIGLYLRKVEKLKSKCEFEYAESDIRWTSRKILIVSAISLLGGIIASLLGLGGGIIIGPVMLELGVAPDIVAATSSYMILFTSLSAMAQYAIVGRLLWDYAIYLILLGLISSIVGQTVLNWLVRKYKMQSIIVICVVVIIFASAILLITTSTIGLVERIRYGGSMGFKNIVTFFTVFAFGILRTMPRVFITKAQNPSKRVEELLSLIEKNGIQERSLTERHVYKGRAKFLHKKSIKKKLWHRQVQKIMSNYEESRIQRAQARTQNSEGKLQN